LSTFDVLPPSLNATAVVVAAELFAPRAFLRVRGLVLGRCGRGEPVRLILRLLYGRGCPTALIGAWVVLEAAGD
jgi:hypothetical protein